MKKIIILLFVLPIACKEAYDPPIVSTNNSFLVVEGFINIGSDSTVITLSRTAKLNSPAPPAPETGARVVILASDGSSQQMLEVSPGKYALPFYFNSSAKFAVDILTNGAEEYQSDFVTAKVSPPIDSINWKQTPQGIQIYANTHDPQNASTYYLWNYAETWEFHSVYSSQFEYDPVHDTIVARQNGDSIYYCWTGDNSTNILLGSSQKLAQDLIYEAPLLLVPQNSWHISVEYSILVRQYVLTADGYNFWQNLQRNTEQIGSVFSPQPSEIKSNIHSLLDSTEPVIGYISAGTLSEKRIFIHESDIPNWTEESYTNPCPIFSIIGTPDSLLLWLGNQKVYTPTDMTQPPAMMPPFRYNLSENICVDCTLTGTNHQPNYWQ